MNKAGDTIVVSAGGHNLVDSRLRGNDGCSLPRLNPENTPHYVRGVTWTHPTRHPGLDPGFMDTGLNYNA